MNSSIAKSLICASFASLCATPLWAQSLVTGSVVDAQGKPVAGYPIVVEDAQSAANGMSNSVGVTAPDGKFTIMVDKPGQYRVVLPTQQTEKRSFEVQQGENTRGLFGIFNKEQTAMETEVGKIQLK